MKNYIARHDDAVRVHFGINGNLNFAAPMNDLPRHAHSPFL
jgi:hypothetical protein